MHPPSEETRRFVESLPASYRDEYRVEAMEAHARLAASRSGQLAVGVFERRGDLTGVCIVTDDRPGLLALISEAVVICELDVVNAEAFTRSVDGRLEAVDLFWLRRLERARSLPVEDKHVRDLEQTLLALLRNDDSVRQRGPGAAAAMPAPDSSVRSRVRFIEDEVGALSTLEIETEDRSGLLLSVSRALFEQRVQVLRCEVRTESTRRVVDRFRIAEQNGAAVGPGRRLEIQVAVLSAIEPAKRLASSTPPAPEA